MRTMVLAAGLLCLSAAVRADEAKIEHPNGPLPKDLVLRPGSTKAHMVWVASAGFKPFARPDKTARVSPPVPLKFMQSLFFADETNSMLLLVTSKDEKTIDTYVGWVPIKYLVRDPQAVEDADTLITKKALIVNKRESIGTDLNEVRVRDVPDKDAPGVDEPRRLFTTMFVFGEADDFFLVGDAPSFNPRDEAAPAKAVLGWLPKKRIAIWNTREAVEWDHESTLQPDHRPALVKPAPAGPPAKRRAAPGRIYGSVADAEAAAKADSAREPEGVFAEGFVKDEKLGYEVSPRLPHSAPRFPVLGRAADKRHPRRADLLRVGGIGGLADSMGNTLLTGSEVKKLQDVLDDIERQMAATDILFVVDDTESMLRWFPRVAACVRKITEAARKNPTRSVRVAVSYYNDVADWRNVKAPAATAKEQADYEDRFKKACVARELKDAKEVGEAIAKELDGRFERKEVTGGGDPHEMVYRGIATAVDKAGFRTNSRKLVIVLGDCGDIADNKKRKDEDRDYADYVKKFNADKVVDMLLPDDLTRQSPTEFYAIQVEKPNFNEATTHFQAQMKKIVEKYRDGLKAKKKALLGDAFVEAEFSAPADYFDPTEAGDAKITAQIEARYGELLAESKRVGEAVERLKKGQWATTKLTKEEEAKINAELKARGLKVTLDELRKSGGFQLFQEGFVWEKNAEGLPQLRQRIFINDVELGDLVKLLDSLDRKSGSEASPRELVIGAIERHVNSPAFRRDLIDPKRIKAFELKDIVKLGNGVTFRTSILTRKLSELEAREESITDDEYHRLLYSRDLLKDVADGVAYVYETETVKRAAGTTYTKYKRPAKGDPDVRAFNLSGDKAVLWYYLDYTREWP